MSVDRTQEVDPTIRFCRGVVPQCAESGFEAFSLGCPNQASDSFYAYLTIRDHVASTAADRQRNRDYKSRRPSTETIARVAAELRICGSDASLRDRLIMHFVAVLLLRNVELAHLLIEDIDWSSKQLLVRGSMEPDRRGGRPRVRERCVPIPAAIAADLKKWADIVSATGAKNLFVRMRGKRVTSEALTPRGGYVVRSWSDRIGISHLNLRRIREGGISSMLEQAREFDISAADVADVAGISNATRLWQYWKRSNVTGQRIAVDAAIEAISPN